MRQALRSALTRNLRWLLYVPPGLTQKDSAFCIQSKCIRFVRFSVPKVVSSSDYEVSGGRDCVIAQFLGCGLEDKGLKSHAGDRGLWLTTYINLELGSRMNGAKIPPTCLLGVYMEKLYFSPC